MVIYSCFEKLLKFEPELPQNLKEKFRALINDTIRQLDLITQEEFEAQTKVLARTQKKLNELTTKVAELENNH